MANIKKTLKRVLPDSLVARLKQIAAWLKSKLYRILSLSGRLSALYYALFSTKFNREQQGVMYGVWKYYQQSWQSQHTHYLLRRNIHRLEKGLLMKPRRDIFAVSYIIETVECFEKILGGCPVIDSSSQEQPGMNELEWAYDVLKSYFDLGAEHPVIDAARKHFQRMPALVTNGRFVPYQRGVLQPSPVSFEDFMDLSHRRKSVRWYLQRPVPRELIDNAVMAAALAPSACNRQPFEFRIFDDPELVGKVSALPGGTTGFHQNFPVIVALVGKLGAYFNEADRHLIYIDSSLAAMAFMYALETQGIGACAINWQEGHSSKKMDTLLRLSLDEKVIMLISLGYPDPEGMVACSQKKELSLLRRYND